jgi:putative transposase
MSSDRRRRTKMPRKRPTPEEIVAKLRQIDVLVSQGKSVADAVRSIGMTEVTYYIYGRLSHCKPILN